MKYLLLYNPVSGKGKFKHKITYIKLEFEKRGLSLDLFPSSKQGDLEELAFYKSKNYDCIIVSGGDGSINEVINGILRSDARPILGVIPSGTANDTASMFKTSKNIKKALKIIFGNNSQMMDINKIEDKYFIYTTAAGLLTKISYAVSRKSIKKFGYFAYITEGAKDIFKDYKMHMSITYENGEISGNFMLALALAAKRVGGFRLFRFKKSKLNDGKLELTLFKYKKKFKLLTMALFFLTGGKIDKKHIKIKSSFYEIKTNNNVVWNIDGEKGIIGSVKINVLKEELPVLVHKKAIKEYF